ncbi:IucA/IucC family C-terminal-domain containing protein [Paenibacillus sp. YN15]|uniref:IucA/IucC family C-terminal-domain containing protein n=1 Tax=Paenibacillus sp. YN15 TaxID=1742774 RepID=UPI0015EB3961|nr:IucA/IucC family C-terminal-domain containing protein [Paenibacillus sp. YN15]
MQSIKLPDYEAMFSVTESRVAKPLLDFELACLASAAGAEEFVEVYGPLIKAQSPDVCATYFASWIGRLCAAVAYAMWHDRLDLQLMPEGVFIQMEESPRGAAISFRLACLEPVPLPVEPDAEKERILEGLASFFGQTIRPVVEAVSAAGGVSPGAVWALMGSGLHYMLDKWRSEETDMEMKARLEAVADILLQRLPPEAFGRPGNPFQLKFRLTQNLKKDGQVRLKPSCCLAYKTNTGHGYCFTCPKLSEEEREARRGAAALA